MPAISTPTDEWFVQDLRGPRVLLDEESTAEFRRSPIPKSAKSWLIGAALFGIGLMLSTALFGESSPPPPVAAAAAAPASAAADRDEYEADWEAAVEQRDPAFKVEKRELPLEPRPR